MNHKNIHYAIISMIIALPLMTHGMQRALTLAALAKPDLLIKPIGQHLFSNDSNTDNLRDKIALPKFKLTDTQKIISSMPIVTKPNKNAIHDLTEYIIRKATKYPNYEEKYAETLRQLRQHGWSKNACCEGHATGLSTGCRMLHLAVMSDLPKITAEFLIRDRNWVHKTDLHKCTPLHYAQSPNIAQMLLDNGTDIEACDQDGYRPLHTVPGNIVPTLFNAGANKHAISNSSLHIPGYNWQRITPLRKAVTEGDLEKCNALLNSPAIISRAPETYEKELLLYIADLRFWQTKNCVYLKIKKAIFKHCSLSFETLFL